MHSILSILAVLSTSTLVLTTPSRDSTNGFISHHEVKQRRDIIPRTTREETESFALRQKKHVYNRYGSNGNQKRAVGVESLSDVGGDSEYYVEIEVGTPPRPYQNVLDTGSADLWLSTPLYSTHASSTVKLTTTPFQIQYGSGDAQGTLASDAVAIAGLPAINQTFAVVTNSNGVVSGEVTGILGAAWQSLASSGAVPLFQAYGQSGHLDANLFSIALRRFTNVSDAQNVIEPGGILTLGGTNSSLFNGPINYVPITDSGSYWLIPLGDISVSGNDLHLSSNSVAIDTGTSLIAAPAAACAAIYNSIAGSKPVTFQGQTGYYGYPCHTSVNVALTFGGISYKMDPVDFNSGPIDDNSADASICLGAFFEFINPTGSSGPDYIVGDSFLKNVYQSYRFSPNPAVGFATLASNSSFNTISSSTPSSSSGSGSGAGSKSSSASTTKNSLVFVISIFGFILLV